MRLPFSTLPKLHWNSNKTLNLPSAYNVVCPWLQICARWDNRWNYPVIPKLRPIKVSKPAQAFLERAEFNWVFNCLHWFNSLMSFCGFWGLKLGISSFSRSVPFKGWELKVEATHYMPLMGYFLKSTSQFLRSWILTWRIATCFWIHSVFCIYLSSPFILRSFFILSIFIFMMSRSTPWAFWPALAIPATKMGFANI